MDLELSLKQKQIISPQMRLALNILKMNGSDLEAFIEEASLENPLIDFEIREYKPEGTSFGWLGAPCSENNYGLSLKESLNQQIPGFALSSAQENTLRYLIDSLDDNGYLPKQVSDYIKKLGYRLDDYEKALETLHKMEPAGVGAEDLRECLILQLKRRNSLSPTLTAIITEYLDVLAKRRFSKLSDILGIDINEVKNAYKSILALNPKPGNGFHILGSVPYTKPDLIVERTESGYRVYYDEALAIWVNDAYSSVGGSVDSKTAKYINRQYRQAKWLASCVEQRKKTIINCGRIIIESQLGFFEDGPGNLKPLSLSDVSDKLGVHVSTVSRAVNGKYLQCQWGVFKLSSFFSKRVGQNSHADSKDMIQSKIKQLIALENPLKPLSDENISSKLKESGISISRRTVAKYRTQLKIPPSFSRTLN